MLAADAICREQPLKVKYCMSGAWNVSKASDCVPHDVGDPGEWTQVSISVCVDFYSTLPSVSLCRLSLNSSISVSVPTLTRLLHPCLCVDSHLINSSIHVSVSTLTQLFHQCPCVDSHRVSLDSSISVCVNSHSTLQSVSVSTLTRLFNQCLCQLSLDSSNSVFVMTLTLLFHPYLYVDCHSTLPSVSLCQLSQSLTQLFYQCL